MYGCIYACAFLFICLYVRAYMCMRTSIKSCLCITESRSLLLLGIYVSGRAMCKRVYVCACLCISTIHAQIISCIHNDHLRVFCRPPRAPVAGFAEPNTRVAVEFSEMASES